jgi:hypothetical protein
VRAPRAQGDAGCGGGGWPREAEGGCRGPSCSEVRGGGDPPRALPRARDIVPVKGVLCFLHFEQVKHNAGTQLGPTQLHAYKKGVRFFMFLRFLVFSSWRESWLGWCTFVVF